MGSTDEKMNDEQIKMMLILKFGTLGEAKDWWLFYTKSGWIRNTPGTAEEFDYLYRDFRLRMNHD